MSPLVALLPLLPAVLLAGLSLGVAALPGLLAPALGGTFSFVALLAMLLSWILAGLAAGRGALIAAGAVLVGIAGAALLLFLAPESAPYLIPAAPFGLGALATSLPDRWGELGLLLPLALAAPLAAGLGALLADRPRILRLGALVVLLAAGLYAMLAYAEGRDAAALAAAGSAFPALWALIVGLFRPGSPMADERGEETPEK